MSSGTICSRMLRNNDFGEFKIGSSENMKTFLTLSENQDLDQEIIKRDLIKIQN